MVVVPNGTNLNRPIGSTAWVRRMDEEALSPQKPADTVLRCDRCGAVDSLAGSKEDGWFCLETRGGCGRVTQPSGESHTDPAIESHVGANGTGPISSIIPAAGNLLHDGYPATDQGNAHRLVDHHGHIIRYTAAQNWLHWTGARWKMDDLGFLMRLAKDTVRSMVHSAGEILRLYKGDFRLDSKGKTVYGPEVAEAKKLINYAETSQSARKLKAMLELASSEPGIVMRSDDFDTDPFLFNCDNATIDLRTGEARTHEQSDYITKLCPTYYDPDAKAPSWDKFLLDVFKTPELVSYVQRVVGYCLTGDVTERAVFVHYGTGSNGKSTFLNTITDVVGGEYCARVGASSITGIGKNGPSPEIARLRGKRLASCIEIGEGKRLNEEFIKSLSGGAREKISARFLFSNHILEFVPEFKIHVAVNHRPEIKGQDLGIWSRIRLIPYTRTFGDSEKDLNLNAKLAKESSGILAWAVRGAVEWRQKGLVTPDVVKAATLEYREDMDDLADFIGLTYTYPEAVAGSGELYKAYREWSESRGERPCSQTAFGLKLAERGFQSGKDKGVRIWQGISLVPKPRTVDGDWTT